MHAPSKDVLVETVDVGDATLWTATQGGGIPLVLCHGGPGLSDNLEPVARMIDDLTLVHRYDQRGSGQSRSSGPFEVNSFIGDLEALRTHWQHDRWVIGGHSWGANLALFYALAHPDRTLGVIYIAGTGINWGWQEDARARRLARLTDNERTELTEIEQEIAAGDLSRQPRFLHLMWSTDFACRANVCVLDGQPLYKFPRNETVFQAASKSYRATLDAGLEEELRHMDAPLLVLHGAEDVDPVRARHVAALAPFGEWAELENTAHSPWLERPQPMEARLREFLTKRI